VGKRCMKREKGEIREWVIGFIVVTFSAVVLLYIIPNQIEIFEEYEVKSLSPRFFPELAALTIGILGLALLTMRIKGRPGTAPPRSKMMSRIEELHVVGAFATAVFFLLVFTYIGFIPAAFLSLSALFTIQGGMKRPIRTLAFAALTTVFLYLFFHYVMKVYFSPGLWMK